MKRLAGKIYAFLLLVAFIIAEVCLVWYLIKEEEVGWLIAFIFGFALGCILAPTVHELGHIFFAKTQGMTLQSTKFFCFRFVKFQGRLRFSFASPFAAEETKALPTRSGQMKRRMCLYTAGGLIFGGLYLAGLLIVAFACKALFPAAFWGCFGAVPYAAYLFLLNLPPFAYGGGKTDGGVLWGIIKGRPTEKTVLSAMEIYGSVYRDKRFSEVEEAYYFDLPVLPEDDPAHAVILDLRYRYYLDKGDREKAINTLNRLSGAAEYLSKAEFESVAAELLYMHALNGEREKAEACKELCETYLTMETATSKRILAAYYTACNEPKKAEEAKRSAKNLLLQESIFGVRVLEERLL